MTREEAKKDVIKVAIFVGVIAVIFTAVAIGDGNSLGESIFLGIGVSLILGGIPSGWRWASNIITAVSVTGIGIKAMISLFLGWIALPVRIVKDIIAIKKDVQE